MTPTSCRARVWRPVLQLADRAALHRLVAEYVRIDKPGGCNPQLKIPALIAGMVAGADSIDDMALFAARRDGPAVFAGFGQPVSSRNQRTERARVSSIPIVAVGLACPSRSAAAATRIRCTVHKAMS